MSTAEQTVDQASDLAKPVTMRKRHALPWVLIAAACFHVAHLTPYAGYVLIGFFVALLNLTQVNNARLGFRWGVGLGWLIYTPHLLFFWNVFAPEGAGGLARLVGGGGVFALWMVLPIWLGLFLSLATWLRTRTAPLWWVWLIPIAWTGIEYFRGELYPLKFSWLSAGYAFADAPWMAAINATGMYGAGLLLMTCASAAVWFWSRSRNGAAVVLAGGVAGMAIVGLLAERIASRQPSGEVRIGGIQLEFPHLAELVQHLDALLSSSPETELCVLSEYTFQTEVPDPVRDWCRQNARHLIVGGVRGSSPTNRYNTVFVIGPGGDVVFEQAKCVPIQFMSDGLPAPGQALWESPWGRIGLCICYDMSYTRVTDELVRQGAGALIVPTMDVETWGAYQHWLHGRVAPVRAAEYGVPIFRLASSGISQHVGASGRVLASLPCPGQGLSMVGTLQFLDGARRPPDRWLAPGCVGVTGLMALYALVTSTRRWWGGRKRGERPGGS